MQFSFLIKFTKIIKNYFSRFITYNIYHGYSLIGQIISSSGLKDKLAFYTGDLFLVCLNNILFILTKGYDVMPKMHVDDFFIFSSLEQYLFIRTKGLICMPIMLWTFFILARMDNILFIRSKG